MIESKCLCIVSNKYLSVAFSLISISSSQLFIWADLLSSDSEITVRFIVQLFMAQQSISNLEDILTKHKQITLILKTLDFVYNHVLYHVYMYYLTCLLFCN